MFSLAGITFLFPFLLGALVLIPVLWWLLRVMPPKPRAVKFPAFFLLKDLKTDIKTAARTPWWLLLLRSLIVLFLILALAEPVLRLTDGLPGRYGSVLVVIDNGWASAAHWDDRMAKVKEYLPQIKRSQRSIVFLPTAASVQDGKVKSHGPMDITEAEKFLTQLKPQPWKTDHATATKLVLELQDKYAFSRSVFLSDGTTTISKDSDVLIGNLMRGGGLTLLRDDEVNTPYILRREEGELGALSFTLERLVPRGMEEKLALIAYGADGNVLDELAVSFPGGDKKVSITWDVLSALRNRVARVALRQLPMASAVFMTDSQWQQHPVGIVADSAKKNQEGFLNEIYYLKRALEAGGIPAIDTVDTLTTEPLSAIVWPDSVALTAVERVSLLEWVKAGGFLIRFAGPNLAGNPDDPLLPVSLRYGQRAMQGAMTWEKPVGLGDIADHSPLLGLDVPEDVTVTRQVLASPTPEVFEKTWLQLSDGTPLLTGSRLEQGSVVLIHTTAGPDWSNFCYSGLYVESLQRLISLSTGAADYKGENILAPMMVLDGFGRPYPPDNRSFVRSVDPRQKFVPSPETPPGLYGVESQYKVFNLGNALPAMQKLGDVPMQVQDETYAQAGERSMKPEFFKWALWLLLADTIVTLFLRGVLSLPSRFAASVLFCAVLIMGATPLHAEVPDEADLMTGIYLAYIETGDQDTDRISFNGLNGLKDTVNARTNINIKGVRGVDPSRDNLYFYPFLYWPMTDAQTALPASAARNLQSYMAEGGMIVIDTRDQQFAPAGGSSASISTIGTRQLRKLTENMRIAELMPVESGHILGKSFYLLDEFPGKYSGGKLWVEKEPSPSHDGVTAVVIGGNDWAAAWSADFGDKSRFNQTSSGPRQRELALRFGVNLIMTALAGNYKADQIHVPYILQRINK